MNKETVILLNELALKLGTTTEYLWGVLIKQAPISSISLTVFIALLCVTSFFGFRWLQKPEIIRHEAYPVFLLVFAGCVFASFLIICFSFESIIAGFLNPEYWALKEILGLVGNK